MAARRLAPDNAESDLARKLRLEARLKPQLRAINDSFVRQFEDRLALGLTADTFELEKATETILREHAGSVKRGFQNRLRIRMPEALRMNFTESVLIDRTISDWALERSRLEAARITATTRRAMARAVEIVDTELAAAGASLSGPQRARQAASILRQNLTTRGAIIAANETQVVAEASKLTEAEVLAGRDPTIRDPVAAAEQGPAPFGKRWDSQGDSVVRPTHLAADSQIVAEADQPFVVGGFQLLYPGDSSLGAPPRETMHCRCSSHYDAKEIAEVRRKNLGGIARDEAGEPHFTEPIGVEVAKGTNRAYVQGMRDRIARMPPRIGQVLQDEGLQYKFGETTLRAGRAGGTKVLMPKTKAPGSRFSKETRTEWNHMGGLAWPGSKFRPSIGPRSTVVIPRTVKSPVTGKYKTYHDPEHVFHHETGHAYDYSIARNAGVSKATVYASDTKRFRKAIKADLSKMTKTQRDRYSYFSERGQEVEVFAESFAELQEHASGRRTPWSMRHAFPESYALVEETLGDVAPEWLLR